MSDETSVLRIPPYTSVVDLTIAWEGKFVQLKVGMDLVHDQDLFAAYVRNIIEAVDGVKL